MSQKKVKKTRKGINWAEEILNFLRENPFGVTITDIAEGMNPQTTRVTVHKYIKLLLEQGKIFAREVGVYNLYYSSERTFLPIKFVGKFYIGMLTGLKDKLSSKKDFKELGYNIADAMRKELVKQFPKSLRDQIKSFEDFLQYFAKLYPYLDMIPNNRLVVEEEISEDGNKALFHFKNSNIFNLSENSEYHFYLLTGMMERSLSRIFRTKIKVEIESFNIDEKSVKISVIKLNDN
ncbi:MAG: ArsR family transcriptional regulator [Promethearchaeota archaeon]|nr:MAG: ArsR family transcriptional regulator [Candidatus Lokiarchaeota archaeon]